MTLGLIPAITEATLSLIFAGGSMQVNPHREDSVAFWSLSIVGAMLLLDLAGYFFDHRLGTSPWFLLAGYALGLCVVFYAVIKAERSRRCDGATDTTAEDG